MPLNIDIFHDVRRQEADAIEEASTDAAFTQRIDGDFNLIDVMLKVRVYNANTFSRRIFCYIWCAALRYGKV